MNEKLLIMELNKVNREIKTHGNKYTFEKDVLDEYGEPTGETEVVCEVSGLFHISKGYVSKKFSDATVTHSKGQPMIMMQYSEGEQIEQGMFVEINGNRYNVTGTNNIEEYSIILDVSLEMVNNGNKN